MPVVLRRCCHLGVQQGRHLFHRAYGKHRYGSGRLPHRASVRRIDRPQGDIFGLGGSSVISRLFGQHRFADGKRPSAFCFYAAIATGLLILVLGLAFRDPMLALLGATDDTWQYASDFYTLIIVGSPFIVSMTPSNLLRTKGHAVQSMIGSVAGTAVNIVLQSPVHPRIRLGCCGFGRCHR